jgi:hypothetical protein
VGSLDLPRGLETESLDCRITRWEGLRDAAAAEVTVDLSADRMTTARLNDETVAAGRTLVVGVLGADAELVVVTLVGRPCLACLDAGVLPPAAGVEEPLAGAASLALGALAASEVLCALLALRPYGLRTNCGLESGAVRALRLRPARACTVCGA